MRRIGLILVSIALCLLAMLSAFAYQPKNDYNPDEKRFVYILNPGSYYWQYAEDGIVAAGEALGCRTKRSEFTRYDIDEQISMLQAAMYMQADGIVTVGEPYSKKLNETIAQIVESGIPVVLVDTDSKESGRSIYIGSDNYKAGQLAAQKIIDETSGAGRVAVVVSAMSSANQSERYNGFADTIAQHAGMEIIAVCEHHSDNIKDHLNRLLNETPGLDAIFCAEASSSAQLGLLIEHHQDIVVVGFDNGPTTMKFVEAGVYDATVIQSAYEMGYQAISYLNDYDSQKNGGVQVRYTDVQLVTTQDMQSGKYAQ